MLASPRARRGAKVVQPGRVDRQRVRMPWVWSGLCVAINAVDGGLRDWVSGAAPSLVNIPTPGRDERGSSTMSYTGSAVGYADFAPNSQHYRPSTALTVYCRYRLNAVATAAAGLFSKPHLGAFANSWAILINTVNTTLISTRLVVAGVSTNPGASSAVGTGWANIWLRWESGQTINVSHLSDTGATLAGTLNSGVISGSINYPATPEPLRVAGIDSSTRASPGGDFSTAMVWDRRLSDPEMYAVTHDPFGFLRQA